MDILLYVDIISNAQFGNAFRPGDHNFHPNSWTDVYVPSDMNEPGVAKEQGLEHFGTAAEAGKYVTVIKHAFEAVKRTPQSIELLRNGAISKR
jgi:hypothetical protein